MNLIRRLFYFLGGFSIGIIILIFFLSGKKTSCDYGPNARTLKNIRAKKTEYSSKSLQLLFDNRLDTTLIRSVFKNGKVIFSESDTKLDSCKVYMIEDDSGKNYIKVKVQNCDKTARVIDIYLQKDLN